MMIFISEKAINIKACGPYHLEKVNKNMFQFDRVEMTRFEEDQTGNIGFEEKR